MPGTKASAIPLSQQQDGRRDIDPPRQ